MSSSFKDNKGRIHEVTVDVEAVRRVRRATFDGPGGVMFAFDLMEMVTLEGIRRLLDDPLLVVDVAYLVCKPQLEQRGITQQDFGASMVGDPIEAALRALQEEVVSFFQNPRDRAAAKRVMTETYTLLDKLRDRREKALDAGLLTKAMDNALEKLSGPPSGTALESSESTQAPSPSAS